MDKVAPKRKSGDILFLLFFPLFFSNDQTIGGWRIFTTLAHATISIQLYKNELFKEFFPFEVQTGYNDKLHVIRLHVIFIVIPY